METDKGWVRPKDMNTFYVYALFDENNVIYYIGKGKGYRINNHVKPSNISSQSYKNNKTKQCLSKIGFVRREILSYHEHEKDAYEMEEYLINAYGVFTEGGVLTNMCKSREHIPAFVRERLQKTDRKSSLDFSILLEKHSLYLAGELSIADVAKQLGKSSGYISAVFSGRALKHLSLQGVGMNKKVHPLSLKERVLFLRSGGMSYSLICKDTGLPKTTVARIIKEKASGNGTSDKIAENNTSDLNTENAA